MHPEYVGILLNAKMHRGIPVGRTGKEALTLYEDGAAAYGLTPCYLRLEDIRTDRETSLAYVRRGDEYIRAAIPTPRVIHNRAIYSGTGARQKITRLGSQGIIVFNANTRYSKDEIHLLLAGNPSLAGCQPHTMPATLSGIAFMMQRYNDLILKPARGSVGQGIMRLRQDMGIWRLLHRSSRGKRPERWIETRLGKGSKMMWPLPVIRQLRRVPYLVQERLPLAEFDGRPFDLRITVQRGLDGKWRITGQFAKLAAPGGFLSNIAQGGSAYPAENILRAVMPSGMAASALAGARSLAFKVAEHLSAKLPLLADLGMDIGITADGRIYFIECNGRDQRYGFREAGMDAVWRDSYRRPMAFARHLLMYQPDRQPPALFLP
ncbi:YheC/YheD family protein [Paenibacillus physcomitrellae]|uniref:YheC/YheD family protein n=1 Tax=Paenibacillus physcomitrellae TaxID=1619311 RepID=A0ABQ1G3A2_9BACL|nr:YheC/YheD family protein [Paenibacillus physcomitrellae]GGA35757.1 hypothetical protein GCM10010917_21160 [Paenibacillus physcomitrellae]